MGALASAADAALAALPLPPPPPTGNCPECIGEVNSTLNACAFDAPSCVSTLNDDEEHFAVPWQYDTDTAMAAQRLIDVATGSYYEPGLLDSPFGISRGDAAAYIAGGVAAVLQGGTLPERPQRRRATEAARFDGVVVDQHTTAEGSEYILITFGGGQGGSAPPEGSDPSSLIDAEFLFFKGDSIVNIRAASRVQPPATGLQSGRLGLSFTEGVVFDRNVARRRMEELRQALRWELVPVITDFDPAANARAPVWFDRLLRPLDEGNSFQPSGQPYPED